MVREWCALYILTWKCASLHNGIHFFVIWTSKSGQRRQLLTLLTWKCASRHNGVNFFDISTSKSGQRPSVIDTFDLEMCFAPQECELFQHLNVQKWSEPCVFCAFWLGNVLRATTAYTFSTSELPKVVNDRQLLTLLTWKCASRQNGAQLFISHLARWLRARRFSEPTFRPSKATNRSKKHGELRLSYLFARLHLLSSLIFSLLFFSSLTLPTSAFPIFIVGSFTSKLPSIIPDSGLNGIPTLSNWVEVQTPLLDCASEVPRPEQICALGQTASKTASLATCKMQRGCTRLGRSCGHPCL